jgi:hypothetical protein
VSWWKQQERRRQRAQEGHPVLLRPNPRPDTSYYVVKLYSTSSPRERAIKVGPFKNYKRLNISKKYYYLK